MRKGLFPAKATIEKNLEKVREKGREYLKTKTTELEQQACSRCFRQKGTNQFRLSDRLERLNALNDDVLGGLVRTDSFESLKGDETIWSTRIMSATSVSFPMVNGKGRWFPTS